MLLNEVNREINRCADDNYYWWIRVTEAVLLKSPCWTKVSLTYECDAYQGRLNQKVSCTQQRVQFLAALQGTLALICVNIQRWRRLRMRHWWHGTAGPSHREPWALTTKATRKLPIPVAQQGQKYHFALVLFCPKCFSRNAKTIKTVAILCYSHIFTARQHSLLCRALY